MSGPADSVASAFVRAADRWPQPSRRIARRLEPSVAAGLVRRRASGLEEGRFTRRNPLLEHGIGHEPPDKDMFSVPGIIASDAPSGISSVRCKLEDERTGATDRVLLEGGVLAVTCDEGGRLEALCGWLARREPSTMRAVIERLRETPGAVLSPPGPRAAEAARAAKQFLNEGLGAELEELFDELDEVALFEGARRWTIARPWSWERIVVRSTAWRWPRRASRVVDLHDGTFLACMDADREDDGPRFVWVRMAAEGVYTDTTSGVDEVTGLTHTPKRVQASKEDGATLPVVGTSLAAILERALDTRGAKEWLVPERS